MHVVLLCATCDLPAKAAVMNCIQYNGYYGCSRCLQRGMTRSQFVLTLAIKLMIIIGERVSLNSGGSVQTYPYVETCSTGPKRTQTQTRKHAKDAVKTGKPVRLAS